MLQADVKVESNKNKQLRGYILRMKLLGVYDFEVDELTSTLIGCSKKRFDILVIPPVETIGCDAFLGIEANEVIIPNTVQTIGPRAFKYASIRKINIPDSVKTIGTDAFDVIYDSLKSIYIGKHITELSFISNILKSMCLQEINISPENPRYRSVDGVLYSKDIMVLIHYPRGKKDTVYEMPSTVREVHSLDWSWREKDTFLFKDHLKQVILSEYVRAKHIQFGVAPHVQII